MLGQIVYRAQLGGGLKVEETSLRGVCILRLELDPDSVWAKRRVKQAGRLMAGARVRRTLVPAGFDQWELLERYRVREVDPLGFLHAQAAPLVVAALKKKGHRPEQCAVAIRGARVDRSVERTAMELCARVRDVCISMPRGGEQLQQLLRWRFGVAIRPDYSEAEGAVRYGPDTWDRGGCVLDLFAPKPELGGLEVKIAGLSQTDTRDLHLAAALWERGQIGAEDLEFT